MASSTAPETARGLHDRGKSEADGCRWTNQGARAPGRPTAARLLARRDELRPREPQRAGTRPRRRGHGRAALARRRVPSTVFAHFAGGGALSAGRRTRLRLERRRLGQIGFFYLFLCRSMEAHTHGGPNHSQFPNQFQTPYGPMVTSGLSSVQSSLTAGCQLLILM